ncbi:hypothetical protein AB0M28_16190 [Streptomyces sp. NPDC051940]|uniref:hypothetical protein n=1 Tax=Streptomyces sp. NPDC051940 TaxID=3155675 RepID=UPI0034192A47
MARRSSPGTFVAVLTAAALAVVGFLAVQASGSAPEAGPETTPSASSPTTPGAKKTPASALPARSGEGERVVYALGARRVWLVDEDGTVLRTYKVTPSNVSPPPGEYKVTSRSNNITGSDGVAVEHVVRFANVGPVTVGFGAAVNGSTAPPEKSLKTGGVRSGRADGAALWKFATPGMPVVVVR